MKFFLIVLLSVSTGTSLAGETCFSSSVSELISNIKIERNKKNGYRQKHYSVLLIYIYDLLVKKYFRQKFAYPPRHVSVMYQEAKMYFIQLRPLNDKKVVFTPIGEDGRDTNLKLIDLFGGYRNCEVYRFDCQQFFLDGIEKFENEKGVKLSNHESVETVVYEMIEDYLIKINNLNPPVNNWESGLLNHIDRFSGMVLDGSKAILREVRDV